MALARFAVACFLLALGASAAAAADLAATDRTIRKEPAYQSKEPLYCLLVFGPEARERAWLVLDGKVLYLDRNGNGDLTEEGERLGEFQVNSRFEPDNPTGEFREFAQVSDAKERARGTPILRSTSRYKGLIVGQALPKKDFVAKTPEQQEALARVRKGLVRVCVVTDGEDRRIVQNGKAAFAPRPEDAPVLWFDGPMTLAFSEDKKVADEMEVRVVTPGLGEGSVTVLQEDSVPEGTHPVAEIVFPGKSWGGRPVTTTVRLDQRCWVDRFHGPVWVPMGVAEGNAQVTLSLPGWEEGHVAPATLEVPVQSLGKMRSRLGWVPAALVTAGALLVLAAGGWYVRRRQRKRARA